MAHARRVVVCLFVLFFTLHLAAQRAIVSSGSGDLAVPQSPSSRVISFSDTIEGAPDGALTATFAIYPDQQATAALWTETQVVQVTGGKYTALLGATDSRGLPLDLFSADEAHWLRVEANGVQKMHLLVSVPYAMKAVDAERFGGLLPSQYVTYAQLQAILQSSATANTSIATAPKSGSTTVMKTQAAAAGSTPQPATDLTDNNTSEVLLVTQQGTGYAIHAISGGDAALFAENSSTTGTALKVLESSPTGSTTGLLVQAASPDSIPAIIENTSGNGQILSLRANGAIVATVSAVGATGNINATGTISAGGFSGNGGGLNNIPPSAVGAQPGNFPNAIVQRDANGDFVAGQISALNFIGNGFGLTNIGPAAVGAQSGNFPNAIVQRDANGDFVAGQISAQNFIGNGFGLTNISPSAVGAQSGNFPGAIVQRDANGSFVAGQISAQNFIGNGFGLTNISPLAVGAQPGNFPGTIVQRDVNGDFVAGQISAQNFIGNGFGLTNIAPAAVGAQSGNFPGAIVVRDTSGNFAAGQINASGLILSGNADFTAATSTAPVKAVLAANTPTSCMASKELLIKTDAPAGQQLFICNPTGNGYVLLGDGTAAGVTGIGAGDGSVAIAGTAAQPTIAVASGGITSDKLAPNAVTSVNIADGSLSPAKITGTAATLGSNSFLGTQNMPALNVTGNGSLISGTTTITASTANNLASINQTGGGTALAVTNSFGIGVNVSSNSGPGVSAGSNGSYGVFGSSKNSAGVHGEGATGVEAFTATGTALRVSATSTTGAAIPALISNAAPGKLISAGPGTSSSITEKFSVDTTGNVLAAGALINQLPFGGSVVFNTLVKLVPVPGGAQVMEMNTTDTTGAIGIILSANGTQAQVAYEGIAACNFDFNTPVNPGDYVGISPTAPGYCRDLGNAYPGDGRQVIGKVAAPVTAQAVPVMLFGPEQHSGTGGTLTTINTGAGLTGGPITGAGTISIANAGVTNAMLQNSAVTVNPGVGLSGGGAAPLGGSITLNNTGALSFNGRSGNVVSAPGDYSFTQIAGTASATQLPPATVYNNQSNTFSADQTINGALATNSLSTGRLTSGSGSVSGTATATTPVFSVTDGSGVFGNAAFFASSQTNTAAFFLSGGPNILSAGTPTHAVFGVSGNGISVTGTASATSFVGDGSGLTNVNASTLGGTPVSSLATTSALSAETTARQSDVANLQASLGQESLARQQVEASLSSSITTETSHRQSDVANLQTSINNVSAADAKLAASNTFTAGTQDFSGAAATLPVHAVLSANTPAACVAGKELLIKTDAPAGQQLFICDASGTTWNLVGDGARGGVASFNGRSGSVSPAANDYSFSQIAGALAATQLPALSGDVTSTAGSAVTTLAPSGVVAGSYSKITVDDKGRAVAGTQASFSDLAGAAAAAQLPPTVAYANQANTFSANQTVNATLTANLFSGNGSGLGNVNAATLNGIASTSFAQVSAANTFAAKQTMPAAGASSASLNLPAGSAPTAPVAGDVWNNAGVLQYRDNASANRSLVSTTQPGGMQLLKLTAAITPASVAAQSCTEQSFTVSGVSTTDMLLAASQPSSSSPGVNIAIGGWRVSAANTVAIQFCNPSRGNSTPVAGTYTFALMR